MKIITILKYLIEKNLINNDLFDDSYIKNKTVVIK